MRKLRVTDDHQSTDTTPEEEFNLDKLLPDRADEKLLISFRLN